MLFDDSMTSLRG